MNRPYFNTATKDIEDLARKSWENRVILTEIANELTHRNKPGARDLLLQVQMRLEALTGNSTSTSSEPTHQADFIEGVGTQMYSTPDTVIKESHDFTPSKSVVQDNNVTYVDPLGTARKKLLNLSNNNSLINYRHDSRSKPGTIAKNNLRIIDELPDQLFSSLASGKQLQLRAVPDPTRDELIKAGYLRVDEKTDQDVRIKSGPNAVDWARYLGFNTSYELPKIDGLPKDAKHTDDSIQTLLFPAQLDETLRNLRSLSNTCIEETGANILYLVFGFLEWLESDDSDTVKLAPLFLVPVQIDLIKPEGKRGGKQHYVISRTSDDIISNISLSERLISDFKLQLPEIDEETTPEAYLAQIERQFSKAQSRWSVKRFATLALLNFSKLFMYLDLDHKRWPQGIGNLTAHPIVSQFFGTCADTTTSQCGEVFAFEDSETLHTECPLIFDADSSQQAVILEALEGKSVVVEGPPGTGKSQTITNLIAAAISRGKRVLFVAEKMEALNVVKRRLDKAGLGDFCLELHSNKTQKSKLIDDVRSRIQKQDEFSNVKELEDEIARYERLRVELSLYAETIGTKWKNTRKTIHEILTAATCYREQFAPAKPLRLPLPLDRSPVIQAECEDKLKLYSGVFRDVVSHLQNGESINSHPWHGVCNTSLQIFDVQDVCQLLEEWNEALLVCSDSVKNFCDRHQLDCNLFESPEQVRVLIRDLGLLPVPRRNANLSLLGKLSDSDISGARKQCRLAVEIRCVSEKIAADTYFDGARVAANAVENARQAVRVLSKLSVDPGTNANGVYQIITRMQRLDAAYQMIKSIIDEVASAFPLDAFAKLIDTSPRGIGELEKLMQTCSAIEPAYLKYRNVMFEDDEIDFDISRLSVSINEAIELRKTAESKLKLADLPANEQLKQWRDELSNPTWYRWFRSSWRSAKKGVLALIVDGTREIPLEALNALIEFVDRKALIENDAQFCKAFGSVFNGISTDLTAIASTRRWYKSILEYYGFGFGIRATIAQAIFNLPTAVVKSLAQHLKGDVGEQIARAKTELEYLANVMPCRSSNSDSTHLTDLSSLVEELSAGLKFLQETFRKSQPTIADAMGLETLLSEAVNLLNNYESCDSVASVFGLPLETSVSEAHGVSLEEVQDTIDFCEEANRLPEHIIKLLGSEEVGSLLPNLTKYRKSLDELMTREASARKAFIDKSGLKLEQWVSWADPAFKSYIDRANYALSSPESLPAWIETQRLREQACERGLGPLIEMTESGALSIDNLVKGFRASFYDTIAREIFSENRVIERFSGKTHNQIRKQFSEVDKHLELLQRKKIAYNVAQQMRGAPSGTTGHLAADYSEMALLKRECGKKSKHIPIRVLVKKAGRSLSSVKPCFMMSPLSVAQYLPRGEMQFDIVIMDEASQIRPAEALGSIARGKQVVIVGDPNQLPPTSFFDRVVQNPDDDDEVLVVNDAESILDAASFLPYRRLRWHYRSRHESLIAFSNDRFYDGSLVIFPSPNAKSAAYGLKFTRVPNGRFVNKRNTEEADVVASAVVQHLIVNSDESIGVVAMNAEQRDLIERCIDELARNDTRIMSALAENRHKEDALFIKNLENVQGDERDVIFISVTYGPHEAGTKPHQRFGPINQDVGWRRINVLASRSRKKMHLFSSLDYTDVLVGEGAKAGVRSFRDLLFFAQTGHMESPRHTGRQPDSPFEEAVANALRKEGFECVPQIGVAGFFIDLAVLDPRSQGRYIIGIECDGATYHSSKFARDRDRLRQEILENLGWKIVRIWSTDWFKDPRSEIVSVVAEIKKLMLVPLDSADIADEGYCSTDTTENRDASPTEFIVEANESLRDALVRFEKSTIHPALPSTLEGKRLLRPAMLEALVELQPTTEWEFVELIPKFLREGTDAREGKYLRGVLDVIAGFSDQKLEAM